ncbi:hypothetical protein [Chryseolinea soli]|uniref:Uncharacterized protein n=1 Tax=Chryseolinea soli TaxID=2321403 RepID=A0A385SNG4_9BACT|nr:hypothetical protein [Chryseolinea soli]AYB32524.1 hypothetical protein D4L85_18940 [Chryseolinea soli]
MSADAGYDLEGDNWVFATAPDGELLGVASYTPEVVVHFTSKRKLETINITFFKHWGSLVGATNETYTSFTTYAGIPVGTGLTLKASPRIPGGVAYANFAIVNFNDGAIQFANGYPCGASGSELNGVFEGKVSFYGGAPSDFLLSGYRSKVPVYNWAKGVKAGDQIYRNFATDFIPFPHQVALNFEGRNHAIIEGVDTDNNKVITLLDTDVPGSLGRPGDHPVIGYLDGFDSYEMTVTNTKANGMVIYNRGGTFNPSFSIPTFTFSIDKSDMQDYAFNFSENYSYYNAIWEYDEVPEYTWWSVNAPSGTTVKGLTVPDEIAVRYPKIKMSNFKYSLVRFTKAVSGRPYLETVPGMTGDKSQTWESYTYQPY